MPGSSKWSNWHLHAQNKHNPPNISAQCIKVSAVWLVGTNCTAVKCDWWIPAVQLCSVIGGYQLYSCAVWLVGTKCRAVHSEWWVPTVQLCSVIGVYQTYSCAFWMVGTNCTAVQCDWWVPTIQLCSVIGWYKLYRFAVWMVGTNCMVVHSDWWIPIVKLCSLIDGYHLYSYAVWLVGTSCRASCAVWLVGTNCTADIRRSEVCFNPEDGSSMSPQILIPTHYSTISLHSQKYHNRKLTSNFLTTCSRGLCLYSALDYSIKGLYIMTTDTLLCLKVNSTFLTGTLTHNIKLLMIQQLPSQPQGLTHN